jgi:hypothetical protein
MEKDKDLLLKKKIFKIIEIKINLFIYILI